MFDSIRKHQRWLWLCIGFLIIVAFVYYFSPSQTIGTGGAREDVNLGSIDGEPITLREFNEARRQALLGVYLQFGPQIQESMLNRFVQDSQIYQRLFLAKKMEQYDIQASRAAMAQIAKDRIRSLQRFGIQTYDDLVNKFLAPRGFSAAEFNEYARQEVGLQQLISLVGVSGRMVAPQEAEVQFRKENEEIKGQLAAFNASNYVDKVEITPEALQEFYNRQLSNYRSPEKVSLYYVAYPATNFLKEADEQMAKRADLPDILEQEFNRRGTNAFLDAEGNPLPEEAAREKIKEELRKDFALLQARRKSLELSTELIELDAKKKEDFEQRARARGLNPEVTPLFTKENGPEIFGEDAALIADMAFQLDEQEPFSRPIPGEHAVYVVGLKEKLPSAPQPLDEVREKVTEDYKKARALELAREAASHFLLSASEGLNQGKTFEAAAKEAGVESIKIPPFSSSTTMGAITNLPPQVTLDHLKDASTNLSAGGLSEVTPTAEGAILFYVEERTPVSDEKFKADFPNYLARLRDRSESRAFSDWFNHEFTRWLRLQNSAIQQKIMGDRG